MADGTLILRMNLLKEFIESDLKKGQPHLKVKIDTLFKELSENELSEADKQTLEDLEKDYRERSKKLKESPLNEVRRQSLKRAFLKYRGLVFDLKTRFDYTSAEVAIQDGLDLGEYVKEVIEEITNELNEAWVFEDEKLSQVRDEIGSYYFQFTRDRLQELYPQISQTFREFRDVVDSYEIHIS